MAGTHITTLSLRDIDFTNPQGSNFVLSDFLRGACRAYRFAGQVDWNVVQHQILCVWLALTWGALPNSWSFDKKCSFLRKCLWHDQHEGVTGDLPTPLKQAVGYEGVKKIQNDIDNALAWRFFLGNSTEEDIFYLKKIDAFALDVERECFFPHHPIPAVAPGTTEERRLFIDKVAALDHTHQKMLFSLVDFMLQPLAPPSTAQEAYAAVKNMFNSPGGLKPTSIIDAHLDLHR